jgi:pSer/pThr/pTyr-binding forkhead associated (FHA) protein
MRRQVILRIILKFNNTVVKELKIDRDEIIIGRDPREHARIIRGPNFYFIEDLNSTNGTFVNGKKINKKFLQEVDEISIGKHSLQVVLEDPLVITKERKIKGIDTTYRLGPAEYKQIFKKD